MRASLGWSVVGAVIADRVIRSAQTGQQFTGTNLIIFATVAVATYFIMKGKIRQGDRYQFAWRYQSPWLIIFWPPTILILVLINFHKLW